METNNNTDRFKYANNAYRMQQNKDRNVAKYTKQIAAWNAFITLLEHSIPIIQTFDNKQLNVRLLNTIKEKTLPKENYYISNSYAKNCYTITTQDRLANYKECTTYIDENAVCFIIATFKDSQRIDANTTIDIIRKTISTLDGKIISYTKAINEYDTYVQKALEIENLIHKYKQDVPPQLQVTINVGYSNF